MAPNRRLQIRAGGGFYGQETDRSAPANYIGSIEYNSGLLADGTFGYNFRYERKYGESYLRNTKYDGHSFYAALQSIFDKHKLTFNFIGAPQSHLQARTMQDMELLDKLGREYNRFDHPYQENYYFKPQFELHHDWSIGDNQFLATNAFLTFGRGGGRYLRNDNFDVETGVVGFKSVDDATDNKYFGRHARWIHEHTGVTLSGYDPVAQTFEGEAVSRASNLPNDDFSHSWRNDSQNDHNQFGINTAYQHQLNKYITYTVGGEARYWIADHYAESKDFRMSDGNGGVLTLDNVQRRYDYGGKVLNLSGFARVLVNPIEDLTVMLDGSYASYTSSVDENPIDIFDFGARQFTGQTYYATKEMRDENGNLMFTEDDYERTYSFFQPKVGMNYNLTDEINALVNYSIAYKEPKVGDWYDRGDGPDLVQELDPEQMSNLEFGVAYRTPYLTVEANYYIMNFKDKIESVTNRDGDSETINAGEAEHKGLEVAINGKYQNLLYGVAFTKSDNTWQDMAVQEIFGEAAEDVVGKTVPFSPNTIVNGEIGWAFDDIPLKVVVGAQYWDDYYGSYTNTYDHDADDTTPEKEAKLPSFFDLNARIVYNLQVGMTDIELILSGFNLTDNKDNFTAADYTRDFNRNDALSGKYYMYVAQAPLRSFFLTAVINI